MPAWQVGSVRFGDHPAGEFEQGAKGVDGGAVRLVGAYADGAK
jgi:phosphoribosylformylglycinamidine cyclo-ligase